MDKPRKRVKAAPARPMLTVVPFERPERPIAQSVIDRIDAAMVMAEEGRLCAVAIVTVHHDGSVTTGYATGPDPVALIGGLSVVQNRIIHGLESE